MAWSARRSLRYIYLRFKRLQGSPHALALGVALGTFIGLTPTIPLHTALIVPTTLASRSSTLAGLLAAGVVSNPLTFAPQYYLAWRIGDWLLPNRLSWEQIRDLLRQLTSGQGFGESLELLGRIGLDAAAVMLLGGALLALPFAAASYPLTLRFFLMIRQKRREKHILR